MENKEEAKEYYDLIETIELIDPDNLVFKKTLETIQKTEQEKKKQLKYFNKK